MKNFNKLDNILKISLSSDSEPSEELNQKIILKLKEKDVMKSVYKRRIKILAIAAALTITMSATVFAAWNLLSPKETAEHIGDSNLAEAFESKNSIIINETVTSGDYNFTFSGVVSGKNLSSFKNSDERINPERTYAVISISKKDGSKMPSTDSSEYGQVPFFVSPFIKGLAPWQYNIASMNGGYSEFVEDGIMYRMIECDGIEIFADRGLYLAVSTTSFYNKNAFNYNELTGEITANTNFDGGNAIFNLPIDPAKGNNEQAEKYISDFMNDFNSSEETADENGTNIDNIDLEKEFENAEVIAESIKKLTFDSQDMAVYEHDGGRVTLNKNYLPEGLSPASWTTISVSVSDKEKMAIQFSLDDEGEIIGRTVKVNIE